ncbi:MAG: hypothetical protein QXW10_00045 [Candidatus Micrarchaeaceae archaeon]
MSKKRGFSLYDIEEYLRDAGAERVNEKALISFEKELEDAVDEFISEAAIYANYAGRRKVIKSSDIALMGNSYKPRNMVLLGRVPRARRYPKRKSSTLLNKQVREF